MSDPKSQTGIWINDYITPYDIYSHRVSKILIHQKTAYQEMAIAATEIYGKALILDGDWQSCTADEFIYHEALVHPAMIAHPQPKTVLILGGAEGATTREVLRWRSVEKVVMVDIDGEVVEACRQYLPEMHQNAFDDPRVELIIDDAMKFITTTSEQWDIIIADLSDPIEDGPSFKLFTQEYYQQIKQVLSPKGYFSLQAGSLEIYELYLHARLINTLKTVFPFVHSYQAHIPSFGCPWGFAICSCQTLETQPDPVMVDQVITEKSKGNLRFFDGVTLLGMLQTPLYVRQKIAQETKIYTLKQPPKALGKGIFS